MLKNRLDIEVTHQIFSNAVSKKGRRNKRKKKSRRRGGYKKIDYVKELSKLAVSNKKKYSDQLINEISKILNKYSESSGALLSGLQKPIKISIHKPKNKKKKGGAYNNIIDQLDPITNFAFM